MKQQPGIGADLSLPISQRGEPGRNDSDPETSSKRHRNGTLQHNTAPHLLGRILAPILAGARPLDKRLTMWYTTRVEFNDTRIAATL